MSYRRTASPLHAARAGAAICWFCALLIALLIQSSPLVLAGLAVAVVGAAVLAGVGAPLLRVVPFALGLAAAVMLINALVTRDGLTVIWRFGEVPLIGDTNVTLEATVYGAVLGLRAALLVLLGTLYTLTVNPDDVLVLLRRSSFRSALTAAIATRMVPVLIRDGRRRADAQRCRAGAMPGRLELLAATTAGVLERALDVAATLELRGYSTAVRGPRARRPWSRHDRSFAASAVGVIAVAALARLGGMSPFSAYPVLHAPTTPGVIATATLLPLVALAPFADRRGVGI